MEFAIAGLKRTKGVELITEEEKGGCFRFSKEGAGFVLPELLNNAEHYLSFCVEVKEAHSLAMTLKVYVHGESEPAFTVRFGLLPQVKTPIVLDLNWMDARELFPQAPRGALKMVCHGRRVARQEIEKIVLSTMPCFHSVECWISDLSLTEEYPKLPKLPEKILVDRFGQSTWKDWKGKIKDDEDLKCRLNAQLAEGSEYPFADWSFYGGWKKKKLTAGTGYFSKCKQGGRWWLTDPEGYAFFSMGPDCVGAGGDCRIDGVKQWLSWLPDQDDAIFSTMFSKPGQRGKKGEQLNFSFFQANLYRAFGDSWREKWERMICGQLKNYGMNTLGNWSDARLFGRTKIPYVTSLPEFPATKENIFRDFPDVFSEEYKTEAARCAQALKARANDPFMIGYFLRNEPAWAFVDHLMLADEVLYNPKKTACKEALIAFLKERYKEVEQLNQAWNTDFASFLTLYEPQRDCSKRSECAREDMREFSRKMLKAYVEIPARECRKVDPNHMILGMRWAWISNPDLVAGWENFDVFSINCYAVDPTEKIQQVADLGVDLPVLIGEFHFGALDAGPCATGLEGVKDQRSRGLAYRYYCESVAAHKNGVGCHYFQCYDQFVLGRFDGENYNIGLFDIASCAYLEMLGQIRECSRQIYEVADGKIKKCKRDVESIPMIAY